MPRTYVLRDAYDKLDVITRGLGVHTTPVIGYLLEEHSLSLGLDNVHLVEDFEKLSLDFIRAVSVSRLAAYTAAERAAALGVKISSFVSFVVHDNIPSLENLPDSFPGIRAMSTRSRTRRGTATTTVNVTTRIFDWLQKRKDLLGGGLPLSMIVSAILQSVPYRDIVAAVSAEGFMEYLEEEFPLAGLHSIRVPYDVHAQISSLSGRLGITQWRLTSYLLLKDLEASTLEIAVDRTLLPNNIRKRWTVLLQEFLELGT